MAQLRPAFMDSQYWDEVRSEPTADAPASFVQKWKEWLDDSDTPTIPTIELPPPKKRPARPKR